MALTDDQNRKIEPKKKKGIGLLVIILILFGIGLLSSIKREVTNPVVQVERVEQQQTESKVTAIFDIPTLIGKDFDQIIDILGTPQGQDPTELQIQQGGITQWEKSFKKDGQELLVTYIISNKKVVDLFISTDDPTGKTKDTKRLLELGNLKTDDPRYKVEFVKTIKDTSSYTGVIVTPN